jgi:hypothetical protein
VIILLIFNKKTFGMFTPRGQSREQTRTDIEGRYVIHSFQWIFIRKIRDKLAFNEKGTKNWQDPNLRTIVSL